MVILCMCVHKKRTGTCCLYRCVGVAFVGSEYEIMSMSHQCILDSTNNACYMAHDTICTHVCFNVCTHTIHGSLHNPERKRGGSSCMIACQLVGNVNVVFMSTC